MVVPAGIVGSEWPSVRETCRRLGWTFDGWQDGTGMLSLSLREDGEYAADTIVISIPRQVGKTYLIACIIFALCLMKPGLKVIWTAQVKDTALNTFAKFHEMSQRPKVKPHIFKVLQGKGDESILFDNGSSIEFGARESGFGRGRDDVDVIVFDEGQHLGIDALENMAAAQNVAANPLTFVMGTPPRPKDKGEFFLTLRTEALGGDSDGTLYIEMSADRGADPMDREQWRKANPSYPLRTSERAMLRLRKKLRNEDSWRREALGVWDERNVHTAAVSSQRWLELIDLGPDAGVAPDALAVDMSHKGEISVAACWMSAGVAHVEEVWAGVDLVAATEWVAARAGRRRTVVIDGASPAAAMIPGLRSRGVKVNRTSGPDMSAACGLFVGKASSLTLSHGDQAAVTDALLSARQRPIQGAGGWGWDRTDASTNIAPVVAVTLALFGASFTRQRTGEGRSGGNRNGRTSTRRAVVQ